MTIEDLLLRLEISGSTEPDIFALQELTDFEIRQGFQLPNDYKQFCSLFGSGRFGDHMTVYCPRIQNSQRSVYSMRVALELAQEEYGCFEAAQNIGNLLNSCFVFATNPNSQDVVWDLRTYQKSDDSYDIYLLPLDPLDEFYLVGRSFLEFINDFCIGEGGYQNLPKHLHPCEGTIYPRFSRHASSDGTLW